MFHAIEEDWFNKLGEECVDEGGGCCIVEHRSEGKGRFGGLAKHDIVEVGFGVGEAKAQVAGSRVILEDLVGSRDIYFGSIGGAIEYSRAGFGDVDCKTVVTAVLYDGVNGVADTGSCRGKVTDVVCKLYGRDG